MTKVLRNAGSRVKLLIARDVTKPNYLSSPALNQDTLDDKVCFSVQFTKNSRGLGFSISSYVGDLNSVYSAGVMVKSIVKGSSADQDGQMRVGDIILSVDGVSLQGCSEQRAMEVLRRTGPVVRLRLLRKYGLVQIGVAKPLPVSEVKKKKLTFLFYFIFYTLQDFPWNTYLNWKIILYLFN
uniref:PDZ domain-containing protein n=1 Tax=Poecilia mexicana TaxID=48701 RepID=A0A3B3X6V2_9TELE